MLPTGTSTQLIGTTYLPSLPLKEIFFYLHGTSRHTCRNLVSLEIRTTKKLRGRQVNYRIDKLFGILCNPALRPISCKIPQQGKWGSYIFFGGWWGWEEHFALLPSLFFYCVGQSPGRVSSAWEDVWLCMSAGAPWRQISWYLAMLLFSSRQLSLSAGCDQRSHSFWSGLGFCARFSSVGQSSLCYPLFSIQGRWLWTRVILIIPMKPRVFSWSGLRDHYCGDWRENWPRLFLSPISIMSPTLHVYENSIHFSKSLLIIIYIQTTLHIFCHLC